jgi:hypothetical protein
MNSGVYGMSHLINVITLNNSSTQEVLAILILQQQKIINKLHNLSCTPFRETEQLLSETLFFMLNASSDADKCGTLYYQYTLDPYLNAGELTTIRGIDRKN